MMPTTVYSVREAQRHDWRDHTGLTAFVVETAIDGRQTQKNVALDRLMANAGAIAEHTAAQARGKLFDRGAMASLLHQHVALMIAILSSMSQTLAPASAMSANTDFESPIKRGVFEPMRVAMAAARNRGIQPAEFDRIVATSGRAATQTFVELATKLQPFRPRMDIEHSAAFLVRDIYGWYANAQLIAAAFAALSTRDVDVAKTMFADMFFKHLEQDMVATTRYYFRRYAAWFEALDEANAHIERIADKIAEAIME